MLEEYRNVAFRLESDGAEVKVSSYLFLVLSGFCKLLDDFGDEDTYELPNTAVTEASLQTLSRWAEDLLTVDKDTRLGNMKLSDFPKQDLANRLSSLLTTVDYLDFDVRFLEDLFTWCRQEMNKNNSLSFLKFSAQI